MAIMAILVMETVDAFYIPIHFFAATAPYRMMKYGLYKGAFLGKVASEAKHGAFSLRLNKEHFEQHPHNMG